MISVIVFLFHMDSEDKIRLKRALELSEENNSMLKKLVRAMRWAKLIRLAYVVIIIGSAVGIFYFFQPYIDQLSDTYSGLKNTINNFGGGL